MFSICMCFLFLIFSFTNIYSENTYTIKEIEKHNSENDCWIIFDQSVYDITKYIGEHDRYMNIRYWCGHDITLAFKTKDHFGRDHKRSSYTLLETFRIGALEHSSTQASTQNAKEVASNVANKYNLVLPTLLPLLLYWFSYYFIKRKRNAKYLRRFNGFWNLLLIFLLLVPSFCFGIFMILRYSSSSLWGVKFDFLYWHVELSLAMGVIAISHFLQRIKAFLVQFN